MDFTDWYKQLPIITRAYVTLCVATTAACALEVRSGAGGPGARSPLVSAVPPPCSQHTHPP